MSKLIAALSLLGLSFINTIWAMIIGWGVSPSNWWVIVGSFFITLVLYTLLDVIKND